MRRAASVATTHSPGARRSRSPSPRASRAGGGRSQAWGEEAKEERKTGAKATQERGEAGGER